MSRKLSWAAALCGLVGLLSVVPVSAADWPGFRGSKRDGLSTDTGLLKEWPKDGPELVWKSTDLGIGFSSVAISGERIFTMGDNKDACYLYGLKRSTGEKIWSLKVGKTGGNYAGPRCTPTVDGDLVYALGQFGDLVCVKADSGDEVWRKNLPKDFKGASGGWNYTESLLIDGDNLVCTPGGKEATMLALNKKTGETVWKGTSPRGESAGYSSIVVGEIGGVRQYIQLTSNALVSFSAKDGKFLWKYGDSQDRFAGNTANIPTPIVKGDMVFASAGYGRGGGLVKVTEKNGSFEVEEKWFKKDLNNKHGGIVLVGDYLYGDRDSNGSPWCADFLTGDIKWTKKERSEGRGSASLVYADKHLYIHYDNGYAVLVPAAPDAYTEKGSFKIPNATSNSWAHPVVLDGKLYLRDKDILWVYNVKAK